MVGLEAMGSGYGTVASGSGRRIPTPRDGGRPEDRGRAGPCRVSPARAWPGGPRPWRGRWPPRRAAGPGMRPPAAAVARATSRAVAGLFRPAGRLVGGLSGRPLVDLGGRDVLLHLVHLGAAEGLGCVDHGPTGGDQRLRLGPRGRRGPTARAGLAFPRRRRWSARPASSLRSATPPVTPPEVGGGSVACGRRLAPGRRLARRPRRRVRRRVARSAPSPASPNPPARGHIGEPAGPQGGERVGVGQHGAHRGPQVDGSGGRSSPRRLPRRRR